MSSNYPNWSFAKLGIKSDRMLRLNLLAQAVVLSAGHSPQKVVGV
jgi:hypothetical protein